MIKVAINGFGRIGRLVFRIMEEDPEFSVVAINDLTDSEQLAYLLKYDTSHRKYLENDISYDEENIIVRGRKIRIYKEMDPSKLPWKQLEIDAVYECTGKFTDKEKAEAHIKAGAKKVIISAPAKGDLKTIVYGVNEKTLTGDETIISAASCTTNCLAPVVNVLNKEIGIKKGYMTTVHAYTNDQVLLDKPHKDLRRTRAAAVSMIPTTSGAAKALGVVLPHLEGRLTGSAVRVPVSAVSLTDVVFDIDRKVNAEAVNSMLKEQAEGPMKGFMGYSDEPLVSVDYKGEENTCVIDALSTLVIDGTMLRVVAWYDNEWGYSGRICDLVNLIAEKE